MNILGIYDGHNCGCVVLRNGKVQIAIEEERLSRIKNHDGRMSDMGLPIRSLQYCLKHVKQIDHIALGVQDTDALHEEALRLFFKNIYEDRNSDRVKCRHIKGRDVSCLEMIDNPKYTQNLRLKAMYDVLLKCGLADVPVHHVNHHIAHASSAYHCSGMQEALVVTLDGKGDNYSGMVGIGRDGKIEVLDTIDYVHSIGHFYSAVTSALGFKAVFHEGKITGLAAYAKPDPALCDTLSKTVFLENNSIKTTLNHGIPMAPYPHTEFKTNVARIKELITGYSREVVAATAQKLLEDVVLAYVQHYRDTHDASRIALAGGVFANVKLNHEIHKLPGVKEIFIQPAMHDGGVALGAAMYTHYEILSNAYNAQVAKLDHVLWGPQYSEEDIHQAILRHGLQYERYDNIETIIAEKLSENHLVARFDGAMEFGPRALGNRSILYNTTDVSVNDWLNKHLKRTEFMPFAPITLAEKAEECYHNISGATHSAQFMTIVFECTETMARQSPGCVHLDNTARPQLVSAQQYPGLHKILTKYYELTGIPSLINTSFNMHEEPIVCSPDDAIRAFKQGHLEYLAMGPFLIHGARGPAR